MEFNQIAGKTIQRESAVIYFLALRAGEDGRIYLPESQAELAGNILQAIALPVSIQSGHSDDAMSFSGNFGLETTKSQALNSAEIIVHEYGMLILDEIRRHSRALCLEHTDVIHVVLDLGEPATEGLVHKLEQLGLFFGGILPFGIDGRHALIPQYLNNVKMDFDRIRLIAPEAATILTAIKDALRD